MAYTSDENIEWICSERPITLCAVVTVKDWACQGSQIWHQPEVKREQGPIRALVPFTLEKYERKYAQSTTFGLFVEASLFRVRFTDWFLRVFTA